MQSLEGASGKPGNWSTWLIMDGADDADSLRVADAKGLLNASIKEVQDHFHPWLLLQRFLKNIHFRLHSHFQ
jgi:hypothetical protein